MRAFGKTRAIPIWVAPHRHASPPRTRIIPKDRPFGHAANIAIDLADLAVRVSALARKAAEASHGGNLPAPSTRAERAQDAADDAVLAQIARSILKGRQRRARYINPELLGEPVWDLMLDLFVNRVEGRRVPTTSACVASGVAPTTALRWLSVLEREKLVRRSTAPDDQRLVLVELTDKGFHAIREYLTEGIGKEEVPLPDAILDEVG
jgi:hypothetical protein